MLGRKMIHPLFSIILIAMSLMVMSYAGWTETLTINNTVNTATVNLTFYFVSYPIEFDPLDAATSNVNPCGYITGDVDSITLTVENAYPGFEVMIIFQVKNIGTLPAKFLGFSLNGVPASYGPEGWKASLPNGEITIEGYNGEGEVLPINAIRTYSVKLKVTEDALQGTNYAFTIGILFEQYA